MIKGGPGTIGSFKVTMKSQDCEDYIEDDLEKKDLNEKSLNYEIVDVIGKITMGN